MNRYPMKMTIEQIEEEKIIGKHCIVIMLMISYVCVCVFGLSNISIVQDNNNIWAYVCVW